MFMLMDQHPILMNGMVWPLETPISLSWAEVGCIFGLIQKYNIHSFFELGIDQGGLGTLMLLRQKYAKAFNYYGIEINEKRIHKNFRELAAGHENHIAYLDLFSLDGQDWFHSCLRDADLHVMVFCDDGNKPREAYDAALSLRYGDLILVHDIGSEFIPDRDRPPRTTRVEDVWLVGTRFYLCQITG